VRKTLSRLRASQTNERRVVPKKAALRTNAYFSSLLLLEATLKKGAPMHNEITQLEKMYSVVNPPVVEQFIENYPHLFPILMDAYEHIVKIFGSALREVELRHEVEADDDDEANDVEYISALIKTNLPPRQAHALQDKFDDEWWLDVEEDMIVITVEVPEHTE
jgi:hypothetical protein